MIYFDNAATTFFKPPQVIDCVLDSLKNPANANRGGHSLSVAATAKITEVRNKVARMVNLSDPLNVAFSQNCTSALNLAILGSVKRRGFHVITSVHEHNSVLRPLFELRQRGIISLSVLAPDRENRLTAQAVQNAFNKDTRLVVLSHVSNVVGFVNDVASIGDLCRRAGVTFIVDAAQSAGYTEIDMQRRKSTCWLSRRTRDCTAFRAAAAFASMRKASPSPLFSAEPARKAICSFNQRTARTVLKRARSTRPPYSRWARR